MAQQLGEMVQSFDISRDIICTIGGVVSVISRLVLPRKSNGIAMTLFQRQCFILNLINVLGISSIFANGSEVVQKIHFGEPERRRPSGSVMIEKSVSKKYRKS